MTQKKNSKLIDKMATDAKSGRINRREFMSYAIAAGMTASTGSLLWSSNVAAAPKKGGTFRVGVHDGNTT
ncbi:MAG: peptide ABC transporter substrate-binding protein, partial [Gammaproteobacteria bacterium]|nr:peptide ABC transporter substrate-binding protein [Gammaproteobacteria bacterium]